MAISHTPSTFFIVSKITSRERPIIAAILVVPKGRAFCIILPRQVIISSASLIFHTSANVRALYSPRDRPQAYSGSIPFSLIQDAIA